MPKLKLIRSELEFRFKPAFVERYSALTDWDAFQKASMFRMKRSIRINTLKASIAEVCERLSRDWKLTQIPWCKEGLWAEHKEGRRDLGNTLEHQLGLYYIQEAASMMPPMAVNPGEGTLGLDMCASPGSKTSQLAQIMKNTGCIIANDYKGERLSPLGMNLMRCGVMNVVTTLHNGERFSGLREHFDWVLCDAPCSGTGTIRKSPKTITIWNPSMITKLAVQQKGLLEAAYKTCKKDGVVVYSTCSVEPEENEGVVNNLLNKYPDAMIEPIELEGLKRSKPIMSFEGAEYDKRLKDALRIWPQDNDTEGFFVCRIRKPA